MLQNSFSKIADSLIIGYQQAEAIIAAQVYPINFDRICIYLNRSIIIWCELHLTWLRLLERNICSAILATFASAAIVSALVLLVSRIINLRANAGMTITATVLICVILLFRETTLIIEKTA